MASPLGHVPLFAYQAGDDYPIYDLDVFITNIAYAIPGIQPSIRVGSIGPGGNERITQIVLPESGIVRYAIFINSARNGTSVMEDLLFAHLEKAPLGMGYVTLDPSRPTTPQILEQAKKPNEYKRGVWVAAWRVLRTSDQRTLLEEVPAAFPRGADGNVDWTPGSQ